MANKKISQLTSIVTVDTAADLFPIVDTSAVETKSITPSALKTALSLNNVDNTTDANKPVSTATQTALDAKQATLVSGTNIKTINSTTILGSGNISVAPATAINATAIATGVVDNTEFEYLNGVTSAIQTQLNAKQATLVSATNIKTINSTSLLGSGDIVISASPSGVSGAIQFSNGSAFASDATNLFWDDTNNRLGVGTNAPSATGHFKGSGSTSATTSLLVQDSAGISWLQVKDNGDITNSANGINQLQLLYSPVTNQNFRLRNQGINVDFYAGNNGNALIDVSGGAPFNINGGSGNLNLSNGGVRIASSYALTNASAQLEVVSTTRGFLPPRMTNAQRTSIASPAVGLVVYCTDTVEGLYVNKSTGWTFVI